MMKTTKTTKWMLALLAIALLLRVIVAIATPVEVNTGGDQRWYLANGIGLLSAEQTGTALGLPYDVSRIPTAPLYLVFVGFWQQFFETETSIVVIRLVQAVLATITIGFAADITRRIMDDVRPALLVVASLAFSPAWVIEPARVATETLYLALLVAGIWAYVCAVDAEKYRRWLLLAGILLGGATLTRAILLAFPIGLVGHWLLRCGRKGWRRGVLGVVVLLVSYSATVSTWTAYNLIQFDRFVIGSDQLMPAIWRGATTEDASPQRNDELLAQSSAAEQTAAIISSDVAGYAQQRVQELATSYLQPHGVAEVPGESLRVLASQWIRDGFTGSGFIRLIQGDFFFLKLVMYLLHLGTLLLGTIGMLLTWRRWHYTLPLIGFVVYTTLAHLILIALPRYIFPVTIVFYCFAGIALWWIAQRIQPTQTKTTL